MMKRATGEEMAQQFSNFVNVATHDKQGFVATVTTEHRFLQGEMFDCMLDCIQKWAEFKETGGYDDRNKYAVEASKIMIDALKAKNFI